VPVDSPQALATDVVVERRHAGAAGLTPSSLEALTGSGALVPAGDSYLAGDGALSWQHRAWVAVLAAWPAALSHQSALRAVEGPGRRGRSDDVIHIAVARARIVPPLPAGVVVHELHKGDPRIDWAVGPPRLRYAEAILDLAGEAATDAEAVAWLEDTCGGRGATATAGQVRDALRRRTKHPRRRLVTETLRRLGG
jgi:hypothetical protein